MAELNTFSLQSDQYAQARPRYPRALFDWLASLSHGHDAAWDVATGNGQAAVDLSHYFRQVQATDVSAEQVAQGLAAPNVEYSAMPAEHTPFAPASFDLVTVAQALHWFDYARFWPEVRRVAKPDALFCGWGYAWFDCDSDVAATLVQPLRDLVAPFWAPNNRILWDGYLDQDIAFPFQRIATPRFTIEENWNRDQLIGYMQTWSAYKKAMLDPATAGKLTRLLGDARARMRSEDLIRLTMPLAIVAGRVQPA